MTATLLTIVSDAVRELGNIAVPSVVIAATDPTVLRMLALSNREGRDLARAAKWTVLQRLHTFTTTDGEDEYALPDDYDRLLPGTEWDRTDSRPLIGPLSPEQWEAIQSGSLGSSVIGTQYRIVRTASTYTRTIRIEPTPDSASAGATLAFWYQSNYWCRANGGTVQGEWAADNDVSLLDRDLMTLGLIVRFKRAVGLEYASEASEYDQIFSRTVAQDRPAPTLSMTPSMGVRLLGVGNLPESGFG